MRIKKVFEQRQAILLLALFIVGVALAPTLIPFSVTMPGDDDFKKPPNLEEPYFPEPDIWPEIRVSATHSPETVFPTDSVKVTASYTTSTHEATSSITDNGFMIAETATATVVYDDGVFEENHVIMTYNSASNVFEGMIPPQDAGTTIVYYVMVIAGQSSGDSGSGSYYVSYPSEPPPPPPPEETDPQDVYPPSYMINDVILDNGEVITWSEFLTATVWGTVTISVTFLEGGNNIFSVALKAINLETGITSYFSFGRAENDYYTWILEWVTTDVVDGSYGMELLMGVTPEGGGGGGGGETGITYTVMSSFGFGGGTLSTSIPVEIIAIVGVVFVGILGYSYYNKGNKMKKKRRR